MFHPWLLFSVLSAVVLTPGEISTFPVTEDIDIASNSVPVVDSANPKSSGSVIKDIFRSARGETVNDGLAEPVQLSITSLDDGAGNAIPFEDGRYIVELFFAEIRKSSAPLFTTTLFDVRLEGTLVLNEYDVENDQARIVTIPGNSNELDVEDAGGEFAFSQWDPSPAGVVKRFEIEVTGGDGLQIDLQSDSFSSLIVSDPILNGLRILKVPQLR